MTQAEMRLIEEGWDALVERLGIAEATRFAMLLDRRTGGALQHLRVLWTTPSAGKRHAGGLQSQPVNQFDA
ncbi:hypothetical protein K2Z83_03610 [Oscillochloris sp. ZM17-4]|uniref:hypothetical protein n=1 Tax=Oscillochloris sp. ZM17-4 TaxID=2866714 RepID=UPI001C733ECA|nr:hypothetical protein [Oscillochloris sp. ZM17-4]MBX0326768.1 hypothetical protein [Oscillochloris sp. ZM17-4]